MPSNAQALSVPNQTPYRLAVAALQHNSKHGIFSNMLRSEGLTHAAATTLARNLLNTSSPLPHVDRKCMDRLPICSSNL
eukprot:511372-Amphidinium_carterae.1